MIKKIVAIGVALIVTVSIFFSVVIPAVDIPCSTIDYWQYDDYRPANDTDVVNGVFEIVEIDNKKYIHAKDIGTGAINGKTETVYKAQLDLAFITGQSNAAYRNANPNAAEPKPELGTAYYFGLSDRCGPLASENSTGLDINDCSFWPMVNEETGVLRVGDKAPSFSATYNKETGHKVYWVCGAIGDKSISEFDPTNGFMWEYMDRLLTRAISLVDLDKFVLNVNYYMWVQGEADSGRNIESYKSLFLEMHDALINGECAGIKFKGAMISLVRPKNAVNSSIAQEQLAQEYDNIFLGSVATKEFTIENGLMGSDDVHYSQLGNNIIGVDLANSIVELIRPVDLSNIKPIVNIIPIVFLASVIVGACYLIFTRK